jgi:hypothetical protein
MMPSIAQQVFWLFVLSIPVATVVRTVIFEEIFRELREYCVDRSQRCRSLPQRKFFYLFTCEYCFSHWVSLAFVVFTGFKLLLDDWRGYVLAVFALVFVANVYLNLYARMRLEIQQVKVETKHKETEVARAERMPSDGN